MNCSQWGATADAGICAGDGRASLFSVTAPSQAGQVQAAALWHRGWVPVPALTGSCASTDGSSETYLPPAGLDGSCSAVRSSSPALCGEEPCCGSRGAAGEQSRRAGQVREAVQVRQKQSTGRGASRSDGTSLHR